MADDNDNKLSVISQDDPFAAQHPHFDFQTLRQEGLKHIGELSGKIWTDHNAHDPGVTMLEELCYALIDLGYRTTLPVEDLLAAPSPKNAASAAKPAAEHTEHKNFFTPQEILSCNPTTILDFRKLLLNVRGVHNAWLEPMDSCAEPVVPHGLYRVLVQKEVGGDDEQIIAAVFKILSAHRNLCEDFHEVTLLEPLATGVCAEVEIDGAADPTVVYAGIINSIKAYITPELRYYTLRELLDKGRPIEDIFAGRRLSPALSVCSGSHNTGFIDTEELEALPLRKVLYGSDLYSVLLGVDGVVAVSNLAFQTGENEAADAQRIPCLKIGEGCVAEFSLSQTCINLRTVRGSLPFNKQKVHQHLNTGSKPNYAEEQLDLPVPTGRYRADLADYYSIQHDFPLVYGIGEGGLPIEAAPLRKAQAMQLKGYLAFYDQLLANYLAQIAHLRQLFSLQVESKRIATERRTYFSQAPASIPDWEQLIPQHPGRDLGVGSILAVPVADDEQFAGVLQEATTYPLKRLWVTDSCQPEAGGIAHFAVATNIQLRRCIQQSVRDFRAGNYSTELYQDRHGYLFILRFSPVCDSLLLSYRRYESQQEARAAAHFTAFLAGSAEYYAKKLQPADQDNSQIRHHYNLVHGPEAYADYLRFLVEDEALYLKRRDGFLDHLLARFATQFNDYAVLRFGTEVVGEVEQRQTVEDKSQFLSRIDKLSRDRGRAYDYLQSSWNTENVSGFEQRTALLAGMHDVSRRYLCPFEVLERFRLEIDQPNEGEGCWFSSIETYASRAELGAARQALLTELSDPANYTKLRKRLQGFDAVAVERIFSHAANDENIEVSNYVYDLVLRNTQGEELQKNKKKNFQEKHHVWLSLARFIKKIEARSGLVLSETGPKSRLYFDRKQMQCAIEPIITYKWHCNDAQGQRIASASEPQPDTRATIDNFAATGDHQHFIIPRADSVLWQLSPGAGLPDLVSMHAFENQLEAQRAWLRCKSDGQMQACYRKEPEAGGVRITLLTEEGFGLAHALLSDEEKLTADEYIGRCQAAFANEEATPGFSVLNAAFGWRLPPLDEAVRDGGMDAMLMESSLFYRDISAALTGLLDALASAQDKNNYFEAGTEDNPDYRILLRSAQGVFIATTTGYADEAERKQHLKRVRERMKHLAPPLEIQEEPRRYRWCLCRTVDAETLLEPAAELTFASEAKAAAHFAQTMRAVHEEQADSPLGQQLYTIGPKEIEDKYRFVYCVNDPVGAAQALLKSEAEFESKEEAGQCYKAFVSALPQMQLSTQGAVSRVSGGDAPAALLVEENAAYVKQAEQLLACLQAQYSDAKSENAIPNYIYRLLDRNNPIAKSASAYKDKQSAADAMKVLCRYEPCFAVPKADPKTDLIRIICPSQNPDKYHYALFLGTKDKQGKESPTLISYMGYATESAAREAGAENWLKLLELALDRANYGADKPILTEESYAESMGSADCQAGEPWAVMPAPVEIDDVIALARCYPIRISYKKDEKNPSDKQTTGFHFQGYSKETGASLWRSTLDYENVEQALAAYRLFITLLGNADSCRIECDEGCYRIHLVEILAESQPEFSDKEQAWGDSHVAGQGEIKHAVAANSVRLFAQAAADAVAYVPVCEDDCYRFNVVSKHYRLARHVCEYDTQYERDAALVALRDWRNSSEAKQLYDFLNEAEGEDDSSSPGTHMQNPVGQKDGFLTFYLGKGYFLQSVAATSEVDQQNTIERWLWLASSAGNFRQRADLGADSEWVLVDPFELNAGLVEAEMHAVDGDDTTRRGTEIAVIKRNSEHAFDIAEFGELTRAYPVFNKGNGYHFRCYYPPNAVRLDEKIQLHCYQQINSNSDQRQPELDVPFCGRAYVYESTVSYASREAALTAFTGFFSLLADEKSYQPEEETGLGPFSFAIINRKQILASHPYSHPDRSSAMSAEARARASVQDEGMHLVEHVLLRPPEGCECLLPACPDNACSLPWDECFGADAEAGDSDSAPDYIPGADAYSFWATLVLPAWAERFRDEARRKFFRQMLYREVPALVGLNIVWLSPQQMGAFEVAFKRWLSSRRCPSALCLNESENPLCDMVTCLGDLRNDPPRPDPEVSAAECDCLPDEAGVPDDCCIEETDHLFWLSPDAEKQPADIATVNRLLNQRKQNYLSNLHKIADDTLQGMGSYEQVARLIENGLSPNTFRQLMEEIQQDTQRMGTEEKTAVLSVVFSNTLWRLLDNLICQHASQLDPELEELLPDLLRKLADQGVVVEELALNWRGEVFDELFGCAAAVMVGKYLTLIRGG